MILVMGMPKDLIFLSANSKVSFWELGFGRSSIIRQVEEDSGECVESGEEGFFRVFGEVFM